MILIKLKDSKNAGKNMIIQFTLVKIILVGDLSIINIQDIIIISQMVMHISVSLNILSLERLEDIISSYQEKFLTGTNIMENYHQSILSLLLMQMIDSVNILTQQIISSKKNLLKEKLKLNMVCN
jgi:hypothetical protein